MPTEEEAIELLARGEVTLPPLTFRVRSSELSRRRYDAIVEASWEDHTYHFVAEYKPFATPKILREAMGAVITQAREMSLAPMVLAPYLPEERLRELEASGVSGLDLSGNGVVIVPGEILVYRTGARNRFPASTPLRNVYRGAASLVPRALLLAPAFASVSAVEAEIKRRGGRLALSTVSRVLKVLEEELVVARDGGRVRLLQADKLLDCLVESARPAEVRRRFSGKLSGDRERLPALLLEAAEQAGVRLVATGAASTGQYVTMARPATLSVYCSRVRELLRALPVTETSRFPDVEVLETDDETAYFDARRERGFPWASPLQTYLELARGDQRDQETAARLRDALLMPSGIAG